MLVHVLDVLGQCPEIETTIVATDCAEVAGLARERCARVALDQGPAPLSAIIDRALQMARGDAARRGLVLMADLPALELEDVRFLLRLADSAELILAPDLRGSCTNALLTPLPALTSRFGQPNSLDLHARDALAAGRRLAFCHRRGLGLDIDCPEDFALFRAARGNSIETFVPS
jgi:2-phospho-L-lactate guanylyltransferase (CobY/MobA/RfbA family)